MRSTVNLFEGVLGKIKRQSFLLSLLVQESAHVKYMSIKSLKINDLMRRAIDGSIDAQLELGDRYSEGDEVPQNIKEAKCWYEKAAEQGDAQAAVELAGLFEDEKIGSIDIEKAFYWYSKAAINNNSIAQFSLGCMYENGEGVTKNITESVRWFEKATQNGDSDAGLRLGELYEYGINVQKNIDYAFEWYIKSKNLGSTIARAKVLEIGKRTGKLNKEQINAIKNEILNDLKRTGNFKSIMFGTYLGILIFVALLVIILVVFYKLVS